jgi:transposase
LPPYSPELNPVEHLWEEIREKYFHNKVFESLETLENHLCNAHLFTELDTDRVRSIVAGYGL